MVCDLSGVIKACLVAVSFVVPRFHNVCSFSVVEEGCVFEALMVSKAGGLVEVGVTVLAVEPGDIRRCIEE